MKANWALLRKKNFFKVAKGFRVELIALLNFLAMGIFHLVAQIGTYQVICYHTIGEDPRFDCATAALGRGHGGGRGGGGGHRGGGRAGGSNESLSSTASKAFEDSFSSFDLFNASQSRAWNLDIKRNLSSNGDYSDEDYDGAAASTKWQLDSPPRMNSSTEDDRGLRPTDHGSGAVVNHSRDPGSGSGSDQGRGASGHGSKTSASDKAAHDELEIKVQKATVRWQMIFNLCHALPALFADTLFGALGDRYGRQVNIMIGLSGMMISVYTLMGMFTFPHAPLFILIISNLISGFTGFMSIIMISCFAYLADTIVDPEMLTVRMTYFSLIMSVPGIFSPQIGRVLMAHLSNAQVTLVAQSILVGAFFLTLFIVKQRPPLLMRKIMLAEYIKEHGHAPPAGNKRFEKYRTKPKSTEPNNNVKTDGSTTDPTIAGTPSTTIQPPVVKKTFVQELRSMSKLFVQLWREVYMTYTRERPGHARLYLLFASFVYFLHMAFEGGLRMSVFGLYVLKEPFNWGPPELSTYKSVNSALHLLGAMFGILILKKLLKLSDTTIILFAMFTNAIECVFYALARSTPMLYVAAATGIMTNMLAPCIKSFISQLVDPDEVGKSFTAFGIATTVAHISSNVLYANIYSATVGWFDGFAFLVAAGLELICVALFSWLHFDYHYDGSIKNWVQNNTCARMYRTVTGRGATNGQQPATTAYSMSEQANDIVKVEAAETAGDDTL